MTGSRLGWVVAPEQVIEKLSDLACNTNYGVPGFIQDAGLYALTQMPNIEKTVANPSLGDVELLKKLSKNTLT